MPPTGSTTEGTRATPGLGDARPADLAWVAAAATPVAEVMTRDVVCVEPGLSIDALVEVLDQARISGAPVVDACGGPIGVVTRTDLQAPRRPGAARVVDIMMPLTFGVPPGASLAQAVALMACEGVHRVVVVDDEGAVVGIVSSLDVVRWLADGHTA